MQGTSNIPIPQKCDVLVIGGGAAGLMCAARAGQRGRSVLLIEHANKVGKKILMSGGGRCNFTNVHSGPDNFLSRNPHFCKSALSRYSPQDFIALVEKYAVPYHEKKLGQLFCDNKAGDILSLLLEECQRGAVMIRTRCSIEKVSALADGFTVLCSLGTVQCQSLVVATGGLSIPKMGATAFGYELARQFDIKVVPPRAALVPFTLNRDMLDKLSPLSGSSIEVEVRCGSGRFRENLLFTHRGLSGPAMLQISSHWQPGLTLGINLLPGKDVLSLLLERREARPKAVLKTVLGELMGRQIARVLCELFFAEPGYAQKTMKQFSRRELADIAQQLKCWQILPSGTEGWRTAEVTLGGVDADELSSRTMEANKQKGLYFIGEVIDVTGHLGGHNFQWAWASAAAAGDYI